MKVAKKCVWTCRPFDIKIDPEASQTHHFVPHYHVMEVSYYPIGSSLYSQYIPTRSSLHLALTSANQTWQWEMAHLYMIVPLKSPFMGNRPLPCLIIRG